MSDECAHRSAVLRAQEASQNHESSYSSLITHYSSLITHHSSLITLHGNANVYNIPPLVVAFGRSLIALTNTSAALPSRGSSWPGTIAPAQPTTPLRTETYDLSADQR